MSNMAGKAYAMNVVTPSNPKITWINRLLFMASRGLPANLMGFLGLSLIHFARWVIIKPKDWPDLGQGMNIFTTSFRVLLVWGQGLLSLIRLIGLGIGAATKGGAIGKNIAAAFGQTVNQRHAASVLRAFWPNLVLKRSFVKAYENNGTAIITRHNDCLDVLNRDADFEVVYGSRMRKLTGGNNFFLGMQPGWDYTRDTSAMHLAMRRSDVAKIILPRAQSLAKDLVANTNGQIDLPADLTLRVLWDMTDTYFGTGGPDAATMQDWATILFWYLFEDLAADPNFETKALDYAEQMRRYLDDAIADRKANPIRAEDVLNRCLALQSVDTPGMDDLGIRNNLLGLLIGAIPTISKACCYAMDELLNRPDALRSAHQAAIAGNDDLMAQYIWEALRFKPHNPVIYRRATRDTVVARSTLRRAKIKKGTMVFTTTLSAMFDLHAIHAPNDFRTERSWGDYIIWGYGMHTCFGAAINRAIIPAILKPVLAQKNLRRAMGSAGQIDTQGTHTRNTPIWNSMSIRHKRPWGHTVIRPQDPRHFARFPCFD
ncbi:cytochrome P450 [Pseudaestuariivita rosea]|uniref:cytochrome P450 n=1 Tax=Pseudaestuariivita rosea TaxID=2763263 RepID=UPI001F2EB136|nr:cytochrome P450 [Pseudaestuariivita rosea]